MHYTQATWWKFASNRTFLLCSLYNGQSKLSSYLLSFSLNSALEYSHSLVKITTYLLTPLMLCVLILFLNSGTYCLRSTLNSGFDKLFYDNFIFLSFIIKKFIKTAVQMITSFSSLFFSVRRDFCWEEVAIINNFSHVVLFEIGANTLPTRPLRLQIIFYYSQLYDGCLLYSGIRELKEILIVEDRFIAFQNIPS